MPASGSPTPTRRRPGRRPRTYEAVLGATARLLESTPLAELSVAQILAEADVGRTSFYEHFDSKNDVVVRLMRRVSAELGEAMAPLFRRGSRSPDAALREGLAALITAASRRGRLVRAASEAWPAVPELRAIWFEVHGQATERLAALIDADRAAGLAPAGADSRGVAAALMWTAERSFHVAVTGTDPVLAEPGRLVEPLVQLFVGTIYGRPVATGTDDG